VWKDLFFAASILLAVAACALYFGPFGPTGVPDPTIIQTAPKPDYFFLWLYALLSLLPPAMETPALLIGPVIAILVLLLLPFLSGEGEKSWRRRPIAVLTVLLIAVTLGTFTHLAGLAPWSPHMNAWSGDPVPMRLLHGTTALERQGALVFQVKQCRNCHSLGETGGQRGPALDSVAVRLTQDQLVRQVIQGGGNMPAYGKNLSPGACCIPRDIAPGRTGSRARCLTRRSIARKWKPALGKSDVAYTSPRNRILVVVGWVHSGIRCGINSVPPRAAPTSLGFRARHSRLVRRQFVSWTDFDMGGAGLAARHIRSRTADGPHGAAPAAHDFRSSADPIG
jgi:hypothetical protein